MLTIHVGGYRGCLGLSLRGTCTGPEDANQLANKVQQLLATGTPDIWVDCQRLQPLSSQGQRALLSADCQARLVGTVMHWCGLSDEVQEQLKASGLHALLHVLPAEEYRGPLQLLHEVVSAGSTLPTPQ